MAGLTKEQVADLDELDPGNFEPRELAALRWTRSLLRGDGKATAAIRAEFDNAFTPEEQVLVKAAVKGMFLVNLTSNTIRHWLEKARN